MRRSGLNRRSPRLRISSPSHAAPLLLRSRQVTTDAQSLIADPCGVRTEPGSHGLRYEREPAGARQPRESGCDSDRSLNIQRSARTLVGPLAPAGLIPSSVAIGWLNAESCIGGGRAAPGAE